MIGLTCNGVFVEIEGEVLWCCLPCLRCHRSGQYDAFLSHEGTLQRDVGIGVDSLGCCVCVGFGRFALGESDRDRRFLHAGENHLVWRCLPVARTQIRQMDDISACRIVQTAIEQQFPVHGMDGYADLLHIVGHLMNGHAGDMGDFPLQLDVDVLTVAIFEGDLFVADE